MKYFVRKLKSIKTNEQPKLYLVTKEFDIGEKVCAGYFDIIHTSERSCYHPSNGCVKVIRELPDHFLEGTKYETVEELDTQLIPNLNPE